MEGNTQQLRLPSRIRAGGHKFCRALLMSSHDTLLLLQRGNTNICLHHIYSAHFQTKISLNLKEIRNRKQNVNLTDLFRSNSGAMWEQPSVNTERAVCLCMEHGSLTGHLTRASCPIIMPPPPAISSTPNMLCSRPVLERCQLFPELPSPCQTWGWRQLETLWSLSFPDGSVR